MRLRAAVGACLLFLACQASPAHAAGQQLPVGETDGVRVRAGTNGMVRVVFTARAEPLYRKIAGKAVHIGCWDKPKRREDLLQEEAVSVETVRAPKRRSSLQTILTPIESQDLCRVWLPRREPKVITAVPLTQDGAVFLDEEAKTAALWTVLGFAGFVSAAQGDNRSWPSFEQLSSVESSPLPALDLRLAKLTAAGDQPPAGAVGYFSDGKHHAAVAVFSASGRRLFVEAEGDGVWRSNVSTPDELD